MAKALVYEALDQRDQVLVNLVSVARLSREPSQRLWAADRLAAMRSAAATTP
jgi:hypothetical protein